MPDLVKVTRGVYAYGAYRIEGRSRRWYWRSVVAIDASTWAGPFDNITNALDDLRGHLGEAD